MIIGYHLLVVMYRWDEVEQLHHVWSWPIDYHITKVIGDREEAYQRFKEWAEEDFKWG